MEESESGHLADVDQLGIHDYSWAPKRLLKMNVAAMAFNGATKNCLL